MENDIVISLGLDYSVKYGFNQGYYSWLKNEKRPDYCSGALGGQKGDNGLGLLE